MDGDSCAMTKRILDLTMEIIYLLTGEKYAAVKMVLLEGLLQGMYPPIQGGWCRSGDPILDPSPPSLSPERNNDKKILEVTQKMIGLLTGEVPIRCQDVTVYFSMEEWEYIEGHKDLYKDVMMEKRPPLTSPDGRHTRGSAGERLICNMDDHNVQDSQGEDLLTPDVLSGSHTADRSTDPCDSQEPCSAEAHMPNIQPGLQSVDNSPNPSNSEEPSPHTDSPHHLLALSRSPDPSLPKGPPDKLHIGPNISPGLYNLNRSPLPINPGEPSLGVSQTSTPNIHMGLQRADGSLDLVYPEESTHDKSHTVAPNVKTGLCNVGRSPDSEEPPPFKSHAIIQNSHSALARSPDPSLPDRSSCEQSHTDPSTYSRLRSLDLSSPKELSTIKDHALTPNIYSARENFLDRSHAFTPEIHPGPHSVERSADPSNPRDGSPDKSPSVTQLMHPEPLSMDRSPVPFNPEVYHPMKSQTLSSNIHSEFHRSLDPCYLEESSSRLHTTLNVNSGPHSLGISPDLCYPEESSTRLHASVNVNSGPHHVNRSPDPCYPEESSTRLHTTLNVNSGPYNVDRSPDPRYPEESLATSHIISNVSSGRHRSPDPSHLEVSPPMNLNPVGPNMHSLPNRSPYTSERDEPCDRLLPVLNINPELHRLSSSPHFIDPDKRHDVTPNAHPDHHSTDRSLDLTYPGKSHIGTLDIQLELPNQDRALNPQKSSPMKSHVTMHSEQNRSLDPPETDEPSASSHTAPSIHSCFLKADRSLDHSNHGVSSLLKSHTVIRNINSLTNRSTDPSCLVKHSEKLQAVPNVGPGLYSLSRSLNPEESSLDILRTVTPNIHPTHHNAYRSLDLIHSEESSAKRQHAGTPDIHLEYHGVSRMDPEMSFSNITPNILPELTSPNPSFSDKSSAGSHSAPNIHSGLQTANRSSDLPTPEHLSSNKSLTVTLNVHPGLHILVGSPSPFYPEEYSSMKSRIISPNIRSIRGRSLDLSYPDETSDKSYITPGLPDRSLHFSTLEESSLDIFHDVSSSLPLGFHGVDRAWDPEVSSHMTLHTVTQNISSLNRSPDPSYPDESTAKSHLSLNIHAGHHSEQRSTDIPIAEPGPSKESLGVDFDVHPELHSVDRALDLEVASHMTSHTVNPNICSLNRSPDPSYPDESTAKSHSSPNIHAGPHNEQRSTDPSIAELCPPNVSLGIDSNVHPELPNVNRSPNHLHPKELFPMKSHMLTPNIASVFQSPERISGPSNLEEYSTDASHTVASNVHSSDRSLDLSSNYLKSSPVKDHTVYPNILTGPHRLHKSTDSEVYFHLKSQSVTKDTQLGLQSVGGSLSPSDLKESSSIESHIITSSILPERNSDAQCPDPSGLQEFSQPVTLNIHTEPHRSHHLPDLCNSEEFPPDRSHAITSASHLEPCSVDRSPKYPELEETSLKKPQDTSDLHPEPHNAYSLPDHCNPEKFPPDRSHAITRLPKYHEPERSSLEKPQDTFDLQESLEPVTLNIHPKPHNAYSLPDPCNPEKFPPDRSHAVTRSPKYHEPERSSLEKPQDISDLQESLEPVTLNINPEPRNAYSLPDPCNPEKFPPDGSHAITPTIHMEPCSVDKSPKYHELEGSSLEKQQDPAALQESSHPVTLNIHPEPCGANSLQDPCNPEKFPPDGSHAITPTIHLEPCSVDRSPKYHELEGSSLEKPQDPAALQKSSQPVTLNIHPEPCGANSLQDPCNSEKFPSDGSHAITPTIHLEPCSVDRSPKYHELEGSSLEKPQDPAALQESSQPVTLNIHPEPCGANSLQDPCNSEKLPSDGSNAITPTIHLEPCSVDRSPKYHELEGSSLEKPQDPAALQESSQPVTLNIHPEPCGATSLPDPFIPETFPFDRSHKPQGPVDLQEFSQSVTLNIHPEPRGASLPDPCNPETFPPDKSHSITPTIYAESCSVNRSTRYPEPERSSVDKPQDVIPNIHSVPHKANESPDTQNPQEISSVKPHSVVPKIELTLDRPPDGTDSGKHSQIKSHARKINMGSGFNVVDRSPDPSNSKRSLRDRSGPVTDNTEQNRFTQFSCSACGKCFTRQSIFLRHWETYCEKKFREKALLKQPLRIRPKKKSTPPAEQKKFFRQRAVVLKEPNTQTPKKSFPCPECGKFYSQKSNLLQHRRIHTGVKPFSCLHCGKCFAKKICLVTHIRIHSGEKPFPCSLCGKCFGQKPHLDRHQKMHTGEKPYPCPECDKSFLQKCDLVKHRRIHAGLKPYRCSECGKSFTETSGLKRHRRLHR